eukprot:CAMPEP_0113713326 /NCGR_PEP_ID=MMETSP0038_2-20120614/31935_1 /TAXON_ID=2898 /ORGANISM="Cryptomonas paramecium" /LENGTH=53 /DNA_ID=CAMNT_0000640051 /DNA_START=179 /DNA_END=340 /DNA_ORIENTATION=+ /assembly_acc=CAM_ASM_000170
MNNAIRACPEVPLERGLKNIEHCTMMRKNNKLALRMFNSLSRVVIDFPLVAIG